MVRKNIAVPEPESRLQVVVGESAGYPLRMAVLFLFRNLLSVSGCGFREGTVPRPVPCRAVNEERLIALDVPGPVPCRAAASRCFAGCGDGAFPEAPGPFPCHVPDCRGKGVGDGRFLLCPWLSGWVALPARKTLPGDGFRPKIVQGMDIWGNYGYGLLAACAFCFPAGCTPRQ